MKQMFDSNIFDTNIICQGKGAFFKNFCWIKLGYCSTKQMLDLISRILDSTDRISSVHAPMNDNDENDTDL